MTIPVLSFSISTKTEIKFEVTFLVADWWLIVKQLTLFTRQRKRIEEWDKIGWEQIWIHCQYIITDFELQDFDFGTFLLQLAANLPNMNFITSAHFNLLIKWYSYEMRQMVSTGKSQRKNILILFVDT